MSGIMDVTLMIDLYAILGKIKFDVHNLILVRVGILSGCMYLKL